MLPFVILTLLTTMLIVPLGGTSPAGAAGSFVCGATQRIWSGGEFEIPEIINGGSTWMDYQTCISWDGTYEHFSVQVTSMDPMLQDQNNPSADMWVHGQLYFNGTAIANANTGTENWLNQFESGQVAYWAHGQYCEQVWVFDWPDSTSTWTHWVAAAPPFTNCLNI